MKIYSLLLSFSILLPVSTLATPPGPYPGYQEPAVEQNPGVLLREGIEKVLAFLEGGGASKRD